MGTAMKTTVAMRASFDATFPELNSLAKGDDRVPGRPLAELDVNGLRKLGFQASDVEYQEPFFVTRCRSGDYEFQILSYLAYADRTGPAWAVRLWA